MVGGCAARTCREPVAADLETGRASSRDNPFELGSGGTVDHVSVALDLLALSRVPPAPGVEAVG